MLFVHLSREIKEIKVIMIFHTLPLCLFKILFRFKSYFESVNLLILPLESNYQKQKRTTRKFLRIISLQHWKSQFEQR